MERPSPSVARTLSRTGAQLMRSGTVGRGLSLAEWSNRDNQARYDRPDHHTLSIYLDGGERVVREDRRLSGGGPDKLCLLPAGHESRWHIGGSLRMFHLYVEPDVLAYRALTAFDVDPRRINVQDLTFSDDPAMAMIVRGGVMPLDWTEEAMARRWMPPATSLFTASYGNTPRPRGRRPSAVACRPRRGDGSQR